jgi:hypothetical protein
MLKVALPVFLRVTGCAVLGLPTEYLPEKSRLVGERLTTAALGVASPERRGACGLPLALPVMLKASAMQAVERITAFARCRWTPLVSMGDASRPRVLPILEDVRVPPQARPLYATRLNRCTKLRASFARPWHSNRFQRLPTSVRLRLTPWIPAS